MPPTSQTHTGQANTAVLVFARTAGAEVSERLGGLAVATRRLYNEGLLRQVRGAVVASGLPALYFTQHEQRGATYGERLANACSDALARGFDHLVVVGGDCPGLRARHLVQAASELESGRSVIGRDRRGGVYLIGLSAKRFSAVAFAALPYCEPVLAKALCQHLTLTHGETPVEIEVLTDVHDVRDLRRTWRELLSVALRRALRRFADSTSDLRRAFALPVARPALQFCVVVSRRGPPAA